jgi:muramoyltetrapeptide carboxypeptidase
MTELYKPWQPLTKGSIVDIIAPASRCEETTLEEAKSLLHRWNLVPRVPADLFGNDLLCANSDEKRFKHLREALFNSPSQAIWSLRGGYGCARLIPELLKLSAPKTNKLFIGFSDTTVLHLFLQKNWHWQTLHGPSANRLVCPDCTDAPWIQEFKDVIFGQLKQLDYLLSPLNKAASQQHAATPLQSPLIGGTLTLVQTSLGTAWQIDVQNKILFLEEVNEYAYHVDRLLEHLQQSSVLQTANAIVFGDFVPPKKLPDTDKEKELQLIHAVLKRFSEKQTIPVFQCTGIGHGKINRCLPLSAPTKLDITKKQLTITITG